MTKEEKVNNKNEKMIKQKSSYNWQPGWSATKLHAVSKKIKLPTGMQTTKAECGAWVYGEAPTEWAKRNVEKGLEYCKKCLKRISA